MNRRTRYAVFQAAVVVAWWAAVVGSLAVTHLRGGGTLWPW